ncbi:outer membrane beta-barrel protein [Granulicella sp. WH15]|uniref:outer membrane beta-barrel protein n=1 Tax=Granulicella sp. WH15 TaxID=2602070 RepID=UPI0013677C8D|nr:outer membrane beta-barrel protein [Granulicella sp. WH15]QHN05560.1 outer membrane beta-barrel protein [Granulicella sp. WH15]
MVKLQVASVALAWGIAAVAGGGRCVAQQAEAPKAQATPEPEAHGFFPRLGQFYREDWSGTAASGPAPARRGAPSPLDSPPFPSADWSYGGSPVIGEPDTNSYPLMTAILGAERLSRSRIKVYGWLDPSVNVGTSAKSNSPEANDLYSRRLELNQAVVYVERLPDSVQQSHVDWGFHLTALYGTDYRFTTDRGYLSSQLIDHNRRYGFDPSLEYVDLYLPKVAQGMNLRVGRFISIPGIEAQLSPNNYFFSHSLLYAVDPFTDTGVLATVKLNDRWLVQAGITAGHDVAPWVEDAKPSATACISYTSASVNDNLYACLNGINSGKYAYNNLQQYDLTWYHRFSKKVHMATEAYYMYQRDVPALGGPIAPQANTNAVPCLPGHTTCTAPVYAVVNYVLRELSPHTFVGFRSDYLNDFKGQRTGYATQYSENTLALSHWFGSTIQLRPEVRFDRAWNRKAYDNGTKHNQFTAASDLVIHF